MDLLKSYKKTMTTDNVDEEQGYYNALFWEVCLFCAAAILGSSVSATMMYLRGISGL